jgi:PAS domain S-box-containing protein
LNKWTTSPLRILLALILTIILAESLIMYLLSMIKDSVDSQALIFIDSILLVFILCPALYYLVVYPLLEQITERTVAECALRTSKGQYRQLIDSVEGIVWEADPKSFSFHFVSRKAEEILGYPVSRWIEEASFWADHLHPDDRAWAIDFCVTASRELRNHVFEYRMIALDGKVVWLRDLVTIVVANGEAQSLRGLMVDISDRKRAEDDLRAVNDMLQKTINGLNEAVIIVDAVSGEIRDLNRATEKIFAYDRDELRGKDISLLHVSSEIYQRFREEMFNSFDRHGTYTTKFRMKRKSGWVFSSEQSVAPISADDGVCRLYVCVVRDISAQILHEEELNRAYNMVAERNAFVESVISNIQSGIIVLDADLNITMINSYAADICCRDIDELMGLPLQEISPELHDQVIQGSAPDEMIATFFGNRLIIGYGCFQLRNIRGAVTGIILTFKDLSEIVKIRNEIRMKQRLSAMGEVVARVAHEMRNPLFGMTSAGQILNMELNLTSGQQVLMDSFLKESRRLTNLVDELLDSTREVRLNKKNLNLIHVVADSLRLVRDSSLEKGVSLIPEEITGEIFVHADADKLEQVLLNLLKNGIEACSRGGRVELSVVVEGVTAVVKVTDNGCGIAEEIMESIFDVFYTTKRNGTGMGLSISRNIIDAHGGDLMAFNNPGGGATFVVKLPLQVETC